MGAVFKHRGSGCLGISCGFNSAANRLEFRFEKSFKIGHDLRAIDHDRPRLSVDRVPDAPEMTIEGRWVDPTRKDPRSRLNRAAITVRLDRDRGVLPRVAYAVGLESDAPYSREEREKPVFIVAVEWRLDRDPHGAPIARDHVRLMKIHRSRSLHVRCHDREKSQPSDDSNPMNPRWRSDALERLHVQQVSRRSHPLKFLFFSTCWFDDRVDSGPRDRSRSRWDPMLATRPRHLQGKTVWEHSPTRRK